jgi:hypothetical protein
MNRPAHRSFVSSGLHPLAYEAAAGLVASFVLSAWLLFDRQNDAELPLIMVSVLLLIAVSTPYLLWRIWRRDREPAEDPAAFSD